MININPATTVAFTGYRPEKIKKPQPDNVFLFAEIQARLLATIHKLVEEGYKTFLSGMAAGFDLMAASAVLLARNTYPEIELICVVPFPDQALNSTPYWQQEHSNILRQAQHNITLSASYHRSVYHRRNDFLIENSSVLVCYYDGQPGGTHYTVTAARKQGLIIENLCQTEKATSPLVYRSK